MGESRLEIEQTTEAKSELAPFYLGGGTRARKIKSDKEMQWVG